MDTAQPAPGVYGPGQGAALPAGPPQQTAEHRETWLDGYGFALRNLTDPGVLADARRYATGEGLDSPLPLDREAAGMRRLEQAAALVEPSPAIDQRAPLEQSIDYTRDRLDRLEHAVGLMRAKLEPVLQPAQPTPGNPDGMAVEVRPEAPTVYIVRGLGSRVDRLTDELFDLLHRLDV